MRLAMLLKTLNPQKKLKGILGSDKKIVGKIVVEKTPKKWLFFAVSTKNVFINRRHQERH